ncbi:MAG TPA: hypothetical protein VK400_14590, partial [Pyrinomonadaceae bacterium]|nr:hypothetical protein [Pyrinomonadaceae bacterium]
RMWEKNLNVKTEIVVKDGAEFETAAKNGDFDLMRRGIVLPTTSEATNMLALFSLSPAAGNETAATAVENESGTVEASSEKQTSAEKTGESTEPPTTDEAATTAEGENAESSPQTPGDRQPPGTILTAEQALEELPAIPLYFPTSYSLVKPYVQGFETNVLDAPSLKSVRIDNNWQPANRDVKSKR